MCICRQEGAVATRCTVCLLHMQLQFTATGTSTTQTKRCLTADAALTCNCMRIEHAPFTCSRIEHLLSTHWRCERPQVNLVDETQQSHTCCECELLCAPPSSFSHNHSHLEDSHNYRRLHQGKYCQSFVVTQTPMTLKNSSSRKTINRCFSDRTKRTKRSGKSVSRL